MASTMKTFDAQDLNIAFFGTPELCVPILEKLKEAGYTPKNIITNPDRPVGRKQIITPPPVKIWAENNNIPVFQPEKLNDEAYEKLAGMNIDLSIVVAYGKIIPERIINLPKYGTLNIHYSLLPKYRGATPVETALFYNETETGVTIQKMVYKLDAGDILAQEKLTIEADETAPLLRDRLNVVGAKLLVETIPEWVGEKIIPQVQDEAMVSKCSRLEKADGEVDLKKMNDQELWNRYRAYYGWPGIFYFDENGKRVKIIHADFIDGKFSIKKILPEGRTVITV